MPSSAAAGPDSAGAEFLGDVAECTVAVGVHGRVQHLASNGIIVLQHFQRRGSAVRALGRSAEFENKHGDGDCGKGDGCRPPGKKSWSWFRWALC